MTFACGASAGSERYLGARDVSRLSSRDPSSWTVEEVMQFIREADPQLGPHADLFRKHVSVRVDILRVCYICEGADHHTRRI